MKYQRLKHIFPTSLKPYQDLIYFDDYAHIYHKPDDLHTPQSIPQSQIKYLSVLTFLIH